MFEIDREHPQYVLRKHVWRRYRDLYAGGEQLRFNAQHYLVRRQREPGDVYAERLSRVFYENYIGSIVDWYAATLFRTEPTLEFAGSDGFYAEFVGDVDRKGTELSDFWRRQFLETMIAGVSYVLVDFPRVAQKAGNRAEEDALGTSRAYLVDYPAEDVINWSVDSEGNYEWVVLRTRSLKKDRLEDEEWRTETRWSYYDKQNFRIYENSDEDGAVRLVDEGTHGLAKLNRVPLFEMRISEGLWLLNRAGLLQLEHFNKSNALGWALTMGLFAMPVVYSDREWSQMVGESYYIQLGPGDKFGWTEPEGKVFQIAAQNLTQLQEEIYRVCYTALWASSSGGVLTIQARTLGLAGDNVSIAAAGSATLTATASGTSLGGGTDGIWLTDLAASPPINRAARDWHTSFFSALNGYGIESTAAFSMELGNGDPSVSTGIAQRDSAGNAIALPTPSIQTNFSPTSLAYWEQVYAVMAGLQASAGLTPFLQFGEVQWWYFPSDGDGHPFASMPFYDAWTLSEFLATYGFALPVITTNLVSPSAYPDEVSFLSGLVGNFTNSIMAFVRSTYSSCQFEVLYPTDTNNTAFNLAINYPASAWTPSALAVLKTEDFGFTLARNLVAAEGTLEFGQSLGFPASQRSQLVGIGDVTTPWLKEARSAAGMRFESVVLFALDQFCLIGYELPLPMPLRRSVRMGS